MDLYICFVLYVYLCFINNQEKDYFFHPYELISSLWRWCFLSLFDNAYYKYCCSVAKLFLIICDPMDCSTPGYRFYFVYIQPSSQRYTVLEQKGLEQVLSVDQSTGCGGPRASQISLDLLPSQSPAVVVSVPFKCLPWFKKVLYNCWGFPGGSDNKESACSAGDPGSVTWSGRSPREGNGNPFQYSCLENPMDRGAWSAIVHGITELDETD